MRVGLFNNGRRTFEANDDDDDDGDSKRGLCAVMFSPIAGCRVSSYIFIIGQRDGTLRKPKPDDMPSKLIVKLVKRR